MDTSVRHQSHQVQFLAALLGIAVSRDNLLVLTDAAVGNGTVHLHKVLIHHTAGTNVEVTHLRVTHLAVRKAHVLAACQKLRMRVIGIQVIHIRSRGVENHIGLGAVTNTPAVKNHKKCFLFHLSVFVF